ncbi:MAG: glycosyltransferase family 2 protein [Clostridia bacterium]|nr:glycosyltransferase family 2 protein [Clostridia bacterium]
MNNSVKISVIIPVYNVETYLDECLNSVLNQDYDNIEIILVDDGSTDKSPLICDNYANSHDNVIVVHKENGGTSDARNVGIKCFSGDYVLFIDGDDYFDDTSAISQLVKRVQTSNPDILCFYFKKYYSDTNRIVEQNITNSSMPIFLNTVNEQLDYLMSNFIFTSSPCTKMIKRDTLLKTEPFKVGVYSEDIVWCLNLLTNAHSLDSLNISPYCYRQRLDSASHAINDKKCIDLCNNILSCFDIVALNNEIKDYLLFYTAYQYGTFFIVQALAKNECKECISKLDAFSWILSYHNNNKKIYILNILCKIFGFKLTCKFIRFFYKNRRK